MPERHITIVNRCIDFRCEGPMEGYVASCDKYHLFSTAGASLSPEELLDTIRSSAPSIKEVVSIDHKTCGAYKNDDSDQKHYKNMQTLKEAIHKIDPTIACKTYLLPLDDPRHHCSSAAVILGTPKVLRAVAQRLKELELLHDHDMIARPFMLANHDSILRDLEISLRLHGPSQIFIFDTDKNNAKILEGKVREKFGDEIAVTTQIV